MEAEIREFTVDALRKMNYDVTDVDDETQLGPAGLDLESLALADLAVQLEDQFHVRFNDDDMETLALMTLSEFAKTLADRVAADTAV